MNTASKPLFSMYHAALCVAVALAMLAAPRLVLATDAGPTAATAAAAVADAPAPSLAEQAQADPMGTAAQVARDLRGGDYRDAAAGVLVLLMLLAAPLRKRWKWFRSPRGGAVLVLILGLLGSFAAALKAGDAVSWRWILGGLLATWTAVGGYTHVRRILFPKPDPDPLAEAAGKPEFIK